MAQDLEAPLKGTRDDAKLPLALAGVLLFIFALTFFTSPEGKLNWLLEVGPGLVGMVALAATYRRFPMTRLVYVAVFVHVLILVYGGYYTYAKAPLGEWAREAFGWQRNNYDKVGHFAFGFFPVIILREVFLRVTKLERGGWFVFILVNVIMGFAALYELFEWAAALVLDPAGGDAFLGTQGYVWDAQSDMLYAGVGAVVGLVVFTRLHEAELKRLVARSRG
jgi:putative membrane protein